MRRRCPGVLSGTFADNIRLDHDRDIGQAIADAQLGQDIAAAGGVDALVGHRGVRLSRGQVQRLAYGQGVGRVQPELLLADDVSSALDAVTEVALWAGLRAPGITVLGCVIEACGAGAGRSGGGARRRKGARRSVRGRS